MRLLWVISPRLLSIHQYGGAFPTRLMLVWVQWLLTGRKDQIPKDQWKECCNLGGKTDFLQKFHGKHIWLKLEMGRNYRSYVFIVVVMVYRCFHFLTVHIYWMFPSPRGNGSLGIFFNPGFHYLKETLDTLVLPFLAQLSI